MLEGVMTFTEASERWDIAPRTLRASATGQNGAPPRFKEHEFAKSGGTWLVTEKAMRRLYGDPKK